MNASSYFSKKQYDEMFKDLWAELRRLDLASGTIDELEESEVFKYSPFKGLTPDQRVALDKIMAAIEDGLENAKPIVVQGMPGTGKTILAIYLLKMLRDDPRYANLNVKLMEPVASLRKTLKDSLTNVSGLKKKDIIGPFDLDKRASGYKGNDVKSFDIVFVDETHRLKRRVNLGTLFRAYDAVNEELGLPHDATQVDWIMNQVRLPVYFYDPLQSVGPSCVQPEDLTLALGDALVDSISLDSQMRVKGGKEYLDFIASLLAGKAVKPKKFDGYDLVLHSDFEEFVTSFEETWRGHELSRMVAGYAWEWVTKPRKGESSDLGLSDIVIDGIGRKWNCTYENWVGKGIGDYEIAHEVGCIHSIQGYDLSYAYVIIGNDLQFDQETGKLSAHRESYFDRNGSATASDEELTQYIENIYYVLLTRGIYGTHVYAVDSRMRDWLSKRLPLAQ